MRHIDETFVYSVTQWEAMQGQDGGPSIPWDAIRLADRELWAEPCPQCEYDLKVPIDAAERRAASILAARIPSLRMVSFANFLTDKRIRPSHWQIGREIQGRDQKWTPVETMEPPDEYLTDTRLSVSTQGPGRSHTRHHVFVNRNGRWDLIGQ